MGWPRHILSAGALLMAVACDPRQAAAPTYILQQSSGAREAPAGAPTGPARRAVAFVHDELGAVGSNQSVGFVSTLVVQNFSAEAVRVSRLDLMGVDGGVIHSYLPRALALSAGARLRAQARFENAPKAAPSHFLVEWSGPAPMIEVVMLGAVGTHSYSVASPGREVAP